MNREIKFRAWDGHEMTDEMVDVEERWFAPHLFDGITDVATDTPMAEMFPDGLFVRRLAKSGTILESKNATHEEAEASMFGD